MPDFALVLAPGVAGAPRELAAALHDELVVAGQRAEHAEGFPAPREDLVYVLPAPRAYYLGEGLAIEPALGLLRRSAFVCVEAPGTPAFDDEAFLAQRAGVVFHTSRRAVAHLRRRGVDALHVGLGPTARWTGDHEGARDIDVLVSGGFTHKRARDVAANAPWLWDRRSVVLLDEDADLPDRDLLARARVFANVHRDDNGYLEWLSVVQAIGAGCAVVSEHALDYEPLVAGHEIMLAKAENLALVARALLDDEARRASTVRAAQARLEAEQPLRRAAEKLVEAAPRLAAQPRPGGRLTRFRKPQIDLEPPPAAPYPSVVGDAESSAIRAALKAARLDLLQLRRALAAQALREAGTDPDAVEDAARSSGYASASPRVSVVTALYNHGEHVAEALDSAAASTFREIELIVTDDGSTDDSAAVVARWIDQHPATAARLLRHRVNRGLGAARNTAVEQARGDYVLFLDSDNVLYPPAIEKLVDAIEADADAVLSYGILEMFSSDGPVGLRSYLPWRPERFRSGNFVDALALTRREWLLARGGFVTDPRLHGWEDYDLWCSVADAGGRGIHVPEIVARYRSSAHSMLSLTDLSTREAVGLLAERHPALFQGVELPL